MKFPLLITSHGITLTNAIESAIREKANKLENFSDRIINCRITVCSPHKHQHKGNSYNLNINIKVPGTEIIVKREPHEDLYLAIRDAFDAATRQLKNYVRKQRGDVKSHLNELRVPAATVRTLQHDEGYGFILTHEGREIYFHQNSVSNNRFNKLKVGSPVKYIEEAGDEGPQATSVTAL